MDREPFLTSPTKPPTKSPLYATVFASDNYDIGEAYILQYQADADADRLEMLKRKGST